MKQPLLSLKQRLLRHIIIPLGLPILFLVIGLLSINHYGINWDEPIHFMRGQAYLHYLTTGEKTDPITQETKRRSIYQNEQFDAQYFLEHDSGHPPLNGILAAASNRLFYGRLGWLGDINAYHLFELVMTAMLIYVVFLLGRASMGPFGGFVAALAIGLIPMIVGESHFNIKDPVETAAFGLWIYCTYRALERHTIWMWAVAGLALGLGLGTKFNILFGAPILMVWILCLLGKTVWQHRVKGVGAIAEAWRTILPGRNLGGIGLMIILGAAVFIGFWPYLWHDTWQRLGSIIGFYQTIGTGPSFQQTYLTSSGWNLYPLLGTLYATPPYILLLAAIGVVAALWRGFNERWALPILWIIWLVVTLGRASFPGASVYGGIRQFMEVFVPIALFSGYGATAVVGFTRKYWSTARIIAPAALLSGFAFVIVPLAAIHPNENVYLNSLVGGLKGAAQRDFPGWGNSYGNAYAQGVNWLNQNAVPNAKIALISSISSSVPVERLRADLTIDNQSWSGLGRRGEYLMELVHQSSPAKIYATDYVNAYLDPVYTVKVQGVPILKIWKNDLDHTYPGYRKLPHTETLPDAAWVLESATGDVTFDFGAPIEFTRFDLRFSPNECTPFKEGWFLLSNDNRSWERVPDNINNEQLSTEREPANARLVYFFAGRTARYLRLVTNDPHSCPAHPTSVTLDRF